MENYRRAVRELPFSIIVREAAIKRDSLSGAFHIGGKAGGHIGTAPTNHTDFGFFVGESPRGLPFSDE